VRPQPPAAAFAAMPTSSSFWGRLRLSLPRISTTAVNLVTRFLPHRRRRRGERRRGPPRHRNHRRSVGKVSRGKGAGEGGRGKIIAPPLSPVSPLALPTFCPRHHHHLIALRLSHRLDGGFSFSSTWSSSPTMSNNVVVVGTTPLAEEQEGRRNG
jgi:hypothetical protein